MTQYHRKPTAYLLHPYVEGDLAGLQAWIDTIPTSEFLRAFTFDPEFVLAPFTYAVGEETFTGCHIRMMWPEPRYTWAEVTLKVGDMVMWPLRDTFMFEVRPAADFDLFEPATP